MNQVRIGVVGCGYWGPNLIRNFVELPRSHPIAVADLAEARLRHIQTRYPAVKTTQDYHDLFSMDLDAVVIATPPSTHYGIARDFLEHGVHVLVEKPITLSSKDALALIELARQHNLKLMVGHTFEYNDAVRALKRILDSGELGKILYIDSIRLNLGLFQRDLNVLWDLAPHDISIIRYLLGRDPTSVCATGMDCIFKGVHDVAHLHLEFEDRITAHIHVSWLDPCKVRRTTVVGERKMVVYDDVEPLEKIRIYDKGVEKPPYTDSYGEFQLSYRYGDVISPHIQFTEPLRAECDHFLDCILNGQNPQSDGLDGLQIVRTLECAQRSLHSGGMHQPIAVEQETADVQSHS